ncbi:MAG: hypothetical protein RR567_06885 [Carnobacterium sp.]
MIVIAAPHKDVKTNLSKGHTNDSTHGMNDNQRIVKILQRFTTMKG